MTALQTRPGTPPSEPATEPEPGPSPHRPRWWRVALVALFMLLLGEGVARLLEPQLTPVLRWPDTGYMIHEEQLAELASVGSGAGDTGTAGNGATDGGHLDLLIVGSSSVGAGIRPSDLEQAGLTGAGYNYWVAGPPMRSVELLTSEVLADRHTPSTVIIGVTMREFNAGPSLTTHLANLRQSPGFEEASGDQTWLDPLDDALQRVSVLARYRGTFRNPIELLDDLRAPAITPAVVADDGFYSEGDHFVLADEPPEHRLQEQEVMAGYDVAQPEVEALASLIDDLRDRGIRVLVVNLPVTDEFIDLADDGDADYERYVEAIRSTTDSHGAEWLDAMDERDDWPGDHFRDVNHLNERGADALQPLVVEALQVSDDD